MHIMSRDPRKLGQRESPRKSHIEGGKVALPTFFLSAWAALRMDSFSPGGQLTAGILTLALRRYNGHC